jgi:hypothetical protein
MRQLFYVFALFLISGCASRKDKANQYFDGHKGELAEKCQEEFPIDTIKIITGETKVVIDTLLIPGVEIPCPETTINKPKPTVKCPPNKTVTITKERMDTLIIVDTQKTKTLEFKLKTAEEEIYELLLKSDKLGQDLKSARKTKNSFLWALIALSVVCVAYTAVRIKRVI